LPYNNSFEILISLFFLLLTCFYVFCAWRNFEKAGQPGWAALIPFFITLVQLQIVQHPLWWLLLMLIPPVNLVLAVIIIFDLAKVFGKDSGFAFGLLFFAPIFVPILAFGTSVYSPRIYGSEQIT
jgi:hypothetical protein